MIASTCSGIAASMLLTWSPLAAVAAVVADAAAASSARGGAI
jgi:hypothetical protein